VDHAGAVFYYLSDVEDCNNGERRPDLVSRIRNIHDDDLIVTWEADGIVLISRPAWNALPPGQTEDGSYPICGYDKDPRTNSTLSYTQQPIVKRVAAYLEKFPCDSRKEASLTSHIRTAYTDDNDRVQKIDIQVQSTVSGGTLTYAIDKSNSKVDIAIGGLPAAIDGLENEQQIATLHDSITKEVSKFETDTSFTTLSDWKPKNPTMNAILPTLRTQKFVIFDTPANTEKHYMEWHVPTERLPQSHK
jgi:hypothetical protein